MQAVDARRARAAAMATASALGLAVDDAVVLSDSNRLVLRLTPCDVVARIAPVDYRVFSAAGGAQREVDIVRQLAERDGPVAVLEPRVEQRVFVRDGFEIAMWTYFEPVQGRVISPKDYAHALGHLHHAMRQIDVATPHFTDRVTDTQRWVAHRDLTPDLPDADREHLLHTIESLTEPIVARGATEQVLHGEPHPWNVLNTKKGPLFVDFENCVRGPVEFDLGWVPREVGERYPGVDVDLVEECRGLALAIVAAHGWRPGDERPGRNWH
jgi:hypothetical protein